MLNLLTEVNNRKEWVLHRRYRVVHHPINNLYAAIINRIVYPITKRSVEVKANLFFGTKLFCQLPANAHFFLFGMKSHDSEIRLTKYFIRNLKSKKVFFDIGAHVGFYSLLANKIMGPGSKVVSFEASSQTFKWLQKNVGQFENIQPVHAAVCNQSGEIDFIELPERFAEDNSIYTTNKNLPLSKVTCLQLDNYCDSEKIYPEIIKMDVEGAEIEALLGMKTLLQSSKLILVMEYWRDVKHKTGAQDNAKKILFENGFKQFVIDDEGNLFETNQSEMMMDKNHINSDNLVFMKMN